jgi:hypothetical protein
MVLRLAGEAGQVSSAGWDGSDLLDADPLEPVQPLLDWESLRLAAICRLFIEAQELGR